MSMLESHKLLSEAWEWCFAATIAVPVSFALAMPIVDYLDNSDRSIDAIQQGIERAQRTPAKYRKLTPAEVFAYQP